jgi:GNAT superfamily N-acetyltransferase
MRSFVTLGPRPAEVADVDPLLDLIQDHASYERSHASITAGQLETLLRSDDSPVELTVVEMDCELVGYAALTFDYSLWRAASWAHLDCLFVKERRRGSGLGKALLDRVVQRARMAGADRLEWQTPGWNARATRFYRREGAICLPKQRFSLPLQAPAKS